MWPSFGPIQGEWWRVATSPFLYTSVWYELVAVTAIAVFGWLLERRHGPIVVLALFVLCGMGGIALTVAVDPTPFAVGGNGAALGLLCAWAVPDLIARRRGEDYDGDLLGTAVFAAVLLLMPLAVTDASAIAGLRGRRGGAAGRPAAGPRAHRLTNTLQGRCPTGDTARRRSTPRWRRWALRSASPTPRRS